MPPKVCIDRKVKHEKAAPVAIAVTEENLPDIFLGTQLGNLGRDERFAAFLLTGKKWATGQTITIAFTEGEEMVKYRIRKVADEWTRYANLKFDWVDDPMDAIIRISLDRNDGSWSYIGTDNLSIPRPQPTMNFGWLYPNTSGEEYSRVVLHEFGHMLGMPHEHSHPHAGIPWDREAVYAYYMAPPNSWSKADVDNNLFDLYDESNTSFSQFDKTSIMIYAVPNELTIGDYEVGWNTRLSELDKQFIEGQYPFPFEPEKPTKPEPPKPEGLPTISLSKFSLKGVKERTMVLRSGRNWAIAEPPGKAKEGE